MLHLNLVRVSVADHRLLDLQGRIFGDFDTAGDQRGDCSTARLAEQQGRLGVNVHEDDFDDSLIRFVLSK